MDSFDVWFGRIANGLTILAAIIAIAGVVWAIRSRAKLGVRTLVSPGLVPNLTLVVTSDGSNPVRNLELIAATLTPHGFAMSGGDIATQSEARTHPADARPFATTHPLRQPRPRQPERDRGFSASRAHDSLPRLR